MLVEILYFDGCPNYAETRALVERVSGDLGVEPEIQMLEVRDLEAAERLRFLGSPTIRVDGRDVEPGADSRDTFVFACRVYRPDTGPSGLPQRTGYPRRCRAYDCPPRPDIHVYTHGMRIVKVRRVGNSNVVSIPREFEANGYTPGTSVLVEELADGELRLMPTEKLREHIKEIGQRVVTDHPEALRILAEHDPDR